MLSAFALLGGLQVGPKLQGPDRRSACLELVAMATRQGLSCAVCPRAIRWSDGRAEGSRCAVCLRASRRPPGWAKAASSRLLWALLRRTCRGMHFVAMKRGSCCCWHCHEAKGSTYTGCLCVIPRPTGLTCACCLRFRVPRFHLCWLPVRDSLARRMAWAN